MTKRIFKFSVFAYFFISFILDGLQRSSGIFVFELLQSTNVSRQNAAFPFSLSWAVANIMGSFSRGLIGNKKSEYAIIFGILCTATGAALCILETDIIPLTIFWGFLFGSGYGIAAPHFSRHLKYKNSSKLSFFSEIAPNLGVIIMPFILCILTTCYGFQSSYLIISGIVLNCLPLTIASIYNINLCLPSIKWRVRKKSSHYDFSNNDQEKATSVESFVNSLEPDLILKLSQKLESHDRSQTEIWNSTIAVKESFPIGRKRSETRISDLQSPPLKISSSTMAFEIMKYETKRKPYEGSFSNLNFIALDENEKCKSVVENDASNNSDIQKENIFKKGHQKNNISIKSQLLYNLPKYSISEALEQNTSEESLKINPENYISSNNNTENLGSALPVNEIVQVPSEKRIFTISGDEEYVKKTEYILSNNPETGYKKELSPVSAEKETVTSDTALKKENKKLFRTNPPKLLKKIPLDIKVHVEEYIFTCDEEYHYERSIADNEKAIKNNNSNFSIPEIRVSNFTDPNHTDNFLKCSELRNSELPNSCLKSSTYKSGLLQTSEYKTNKETELNKRMQISVKMRQIIHFVNEMTSPKCLCIIFVSIIFEMNLVSMLTMFADFGRDIDSSYSNFKWILVAFGIGGIFGKFCCCKISKTMPEKSHTIAVILFLLTGLSTAGVLFSSNLNWFASFYGILGALEGGITYTIPKLISEYMDRNVHSALYSVKSFLTGLAIMCIPYAVGLSRDELGDYEFLLQMLSCSSVLCAVFVYFLPNCSTTSEKQLTADSKEKIETA